MEALRKTFSKHPKVLESSIVVAYGGVQKEVVIVPGDGNCFFYSVLHQLTGNLTKPIVENNKKKYKLN